MVEGLGFGTWLYRGLRFNLFVEPKKIQPFVVSWVMGLGHWIDPQFRALLGQIHGPARCRSLGYQIKICFEGFLLFRLYMFARFLLDISFLEIEMLICFCGKKDI